MRYARHQIRSALTSSRDSNVRILAVICDLSSIHAASFKPMHPLTGTQSHPHFVILTPLHWCSSTRKTLCERRNICVEAEGCSSTTCLHNVLCGGALRARSLQCSKWVFSLVLGHRIFASLPHRGKNPVCPAKKTVLSLKKIRSQLQDRWAGSGWRAGPGWGTGPGRAGGGKGTCLFLHKKKVRRNRLECRFGAVCRVKKQVFFTCFFPGGTDFFPRYTGFFP